MAKLLDDIDKVVHSKYEGSNRKQALEMLRKMKPFRDGPTLNKMDKFLRDFRAKYAVGSIIVSRQLTSQSNCWYVTYSVGNSLSQFHTLQTESIEEAYVKLCLDLFRRVKMGEYKCRGEWR